MYGSASIPHWPLFPVRSNELGVVMRLQENRAAVRFGSGLEGSQNNLHTNIGIATYINTENSFGFLGFFFSLPPKKKGALAPRRKGHYLNPRKKDWCFPSHWNGCHGDEPPEELGDVRISLCGCVVSAAACVSEDIRQTARPVSTPPSSRRCPLDTSVCTYSHPHVCAFTHQRRSRWR